MSLFAREWKTSRKGEMNTHINMSQSIVFNWEFISGSALDWRTNVNAKNTERTLRNNMQYIGNKKTLGLTKYFLFITWKTQLRSYAEKHVYHNFAWFPRYRFRLHSGKKFDLMNEKRISPFPTISKSIIFDIYFTIISIQFQHSWEKEQKL
jgi:hypothetical protein